MKEVILELSNIKKSFHDNVVHRGVNLKLHKGETLGLLGNSGTGKSVLLRSIIGLEFVDDGEIYFKGNPIAQFSEAEFMKIRTKISYAFQSGALFDSVNVFENIAYPLFEHTKLGIEEIENKVKEVLQLIGLPGKEHIMPSSLSGGMQKRVGLARSMILGPDIILYDEPTAGLDPINTLNILTIMETLKKQGLASIFVTHDIPAAIRVCDKVAILDQGKVAFEGTPRELESSSDPIVKRFFAMKEEEERKKI